MASRENERNPRGELGKGRERAGAIFNIFSPLPPQNSRYHF